MNNLTPAAYIAIAMASVIAILIIILVIDVILSRKTEQDGGVTVNTPQGSVVTVRKIGRTTRVDIRPDLHDSWEGSTPVEVKPASVELTRRLEPDLYNEYMSPDTPASRKYEIADYIYSIGLTLPYIRGLNELWKEEQEAMARQNPATEHTPVNPKGGKMVKGIVYKTLEADSRLRNEEAPDLDTDAQDGTSYPQSGEENHQ